MRRLRVGLCPFACFFPHNALQGFRIGNRQFETRAEWQHFRRDFQRVGDQHDGLVDISAQCNVFQLPDVERFVQVGVEIHQDVDAVAGRRLDVTQQFFRA